MLIKIPVPSNKAKTSAEKPPPGAGSTPTKIVNLLIDKITITANVPKPLQKAVNAAFAEIQATSNLLLPAKKPGGYKRVHLIALGSGKGQMALIAFDHQKSYIPDLRLEFNPAKVGAEGMSSLREVLDKLLPFGGWDFLMAVGHVSRLDVAADLHGVRMHQIHVLPQQVLTTKTYENKGKLKTIYVGKPTGSQLTVYSKSFQMAQRGKPLPDPVVRVEKRLRNVGKDLSELAELGNPLLGFSIVSTPPGPPPGEQTPKNSYIWRLFLDSVALRTLGPALKLLPEARMTAYRKHFKGYEQPRWDAEEVWASWPETLVKMRLTSTEFWE